jgi:phage gp29-like protein
VNLPGFESLGLRWRQMRFNPLKSLTPERLTSAIDSADAGWLREFALILEAIGKRDAICKTVLSKRSAAVARQPWDVVISQGEEENPEAQAHKETLEHFYNHLSVTDATDLNVRTGMAGLVRQMMDAILQRYAVHEIVWKPTGEGLSAELRRVPLYFFENRTGRLRYIGPETRADGMPLEEDGWMITVADAVGEAISICYMFRRLSVQDWVAFSEKFSIPGVLGRTTHAKGSPEADAFRDSVAAFGSEWVGVFYNDDGSVKSPLEIIQTVAGSTLPQKEMCDYMDRLITVLVRGGDLGTLSRENSQGASLQGGELDNILADDCELVTETLQTQLDPVVIRLVHGAVKPLAHVVIAPPADEDQKREIEIDEALERLGVRQAPAEIAERYGRQHVDSAPEQPAANERESAVQTLRTALAADLRPLGDALFAAMNAGDVPAMRAALNRVRMNLPTASPELESAMATLMAAAFTGETTEPNDP